VTEQPIQLVRLGGATRAPICDGDVCYLPDSTLDSLGLPSAQGEQRPDHEADADDDERVA
jgi:hypothetical protein